MYKEIKDINTDSEPIEGIVVPTATWEKMEALAKGLNESKLSDSDKEVISIAITGKANTLRDIESDKLKGIRVLTKNRSINITEKSDPIAVMLSDLSLGVMEEVELIHSGFKVTLKPITDDMFIALDARLAKETIRLGRETNGLIYSNYSVALAKLIVDFIVPNIQKHTLKLDKSDNIMDYIKIQDLPQLLLGVINSRYSNGVTIVRGCVNSTVLVDGKPKCTHAISALLDASKLSYIDRDRVTDEMDSFLSKESVTKSEVETYQNRLFSSVNSSVNIDVNGKTLTINFKIPTIKEYIEIGEYWVKKVLKKTDNLLREKVTEEEKESLIEMQSKQMYLGSYLHLIRSINTPSVQIDHLSKLNQTLAMLSGTKEVYEGILEGINKFKNEITFAVIGLPEYVCPSCSVEQSEEVVIPLDMIKTFFDLASLQNTLIMERG